jgi:DNA repair exonuclease SbcCD ATPase subunit
MAGVEKVSEQEIIEAAENLLNEANGELRRVSARQVQKRSGGSNKRINEIVGAWKERKAGEPSMPDPGEGPAPMVPDAVSQAIEEATEKLRNLGPLVGGLIEEAARTERQRCDREIALEQERSKAAIEEKEKDLAAAHDESHAYSEDLDRLESERADLEARLEDQRTELSEEREAKVGLTEELKKNRAKLAEAERQEERATAEAARQKELVEVSERATTKLEAQLTAASKAHRNDIAESRRVHREELEAFRVDYKDIQKQARETASELSEANATIRHLREQLSQGPAPNQEPGNIKR